MEEKETRRLWYLGLLVFLILLMMVGGIGYGLWQSQPGTGEKVLEAVKPASNAAEIVTAPPTISKPKIAVWNGSGVSGAAGKLAEKFVAEGYTVSEAKNAPSPQSGSSLYLSEKFVHQRETLTSLLEKFGLKDVAVKTEATEEYEVRIILGK